MAKERLQKLLAGIGMGSRREIERWIEEGLIFLNGALAKKGDVASSEDKIEVKGQRVQISEKPQNKIRVLIYHKPVGEISSRFDPRHSRTVFDNLPKLSDGRWIQIGRLDINTSGLLLFTNHGDLAHQLMHPKHEMVREYAVRVRGEVTPTMIKALKEGVMLEDGSAKFHSIQYRGGDGSNAWYHVTLKEGRNREVRRLWQSQGVDVSRLIRVRFGEVCLPRSLRRGAYCELSPEEISKWILKDIGMSDPFAKTPEKAPQKAPSKTSQKPPQKAPQKALKKGSQKAPQKSPQKGRRRHD